MTAEVSLPEAAELMEATQQYWTHGESHGSYREARYKMPGSDRVIFASAGTKAPPGATMVSDAGYRIVVAQAAEASSQQNQQRVDDLRAQRRAKFPNFTEEQLDALGL